MSTKVETPILDQLSDAKVFKVIADADGTFEFVELCDDWYGHSLTREQMLALADELRLLANNSKFTGGLPSRGMMG